ncbi:hypothetical protein PF010_g2939 [Phytophthora fragariae]|uniref:Uncharacterized protein n=1 Tax=Phytophthora fragariae TaxID=53985 RepID=A0A6A3ENW0_9STRA|nr:hypothetical protein PF003_g17755 [Phytophthora fragariae]KAE8931758.1 hypothetical protein PF009_g18195 [Phytophthora fragariae]KAE9128883.1 hypothetical protein PF006_g16168 [Phytophthora fragariae]KAE9133091.1 hypothetical protein PF010_g2939 [Phytophthora fragariae]KAE9134104.1 hypothetical protein PF007_g3067 [Phytophthora fragariae]
MSSSSGVCPCSFRRFSPSLTTAFIVLIADCLALRAFLLAPGAVLTFVRNSCPPSLLGSLSRATTGQSAL